jgi:hypothetical protein
VPYERRDFESKLQTKFGFVEDKRRSVDHKWYTLQLDGLPVITTKVSHSGRDITDDIAHFIARQLKVRHQFLRGMIDCTRSRQDYTDQVRRDPQPPFPPRSLTT